MRRTKINWRCLLGLHQYKRYGQLVEQLFVGGYCAWLRCQREGCKKVKFDRCDKKTPTEAGVE